MKTSLHEAATEQVRRTVIVVVFVAAQMWRSPTATLVKGGVPCNEKLQQEAIGRLKAAFADLTWSLEGIGDVSISPPEKFELECNDMQQIVAVKFAGAKAMTLTLKEGKIFGVCRKSFGIGLFDNRKELTVGFSKKLELDDGGVLLIDNERNEISKASLKRQSEKLVFTDDAAKCPVIQTVLENALARSGMDLAQFSATVISRRVQAALYECDPKVLKEVTKWLVDTFAPPKFLSWYKDQWALENEPSMTLESVKEITKDNWVIACSSSGKLWSIMTSLKKPLQVTHKFTPGKAQVSCDATDSSSSSATLPKKSYSLTETIQLEVTLSSEAQYVAPLSPYRYGDLTIVHSFRHGKEDKIPSPCKFVEEKLLDTRANLKAKFEELEQLPWFLDCLPDAKGQSKAQSIADVLNPLLFDYRADARDELGTIAALGKITPAMLTITCGPTNEPERIYIKDAVLHATGTLPPGLCGDNQAPQKAAAVFKATALLSFTLVQSYKGKEPDRPALHDVKIEEPVEACPKVEPLIRFYIANRFSASVVESLGKLPTADRHMQLLTEWSREKFEEGVKGMVKFERSRAAIPCNEYTTNRILELLNDLTGFAFFYHNDASASLQSDGITRKDVILECYPPLNSNMLRTLEIKASEKILRKPGDGPFGIRLIQERPGGQLNAEISHRRGDSYELTKTITTIFGDAFKALQTALSKVQLDAEGKKLKKKDDDKLTPCTAEIKRLVSNLNSLKTFRFPNKGCQVTADFSKSKFTADAMTFSCGKDPWGKTRLLKAATRPDQPVKFTISGQFCALCLHTAGLKATQTADLSTPMQLVGDLILKFDSVAPYGSFSVYRWMDTYPKECSPNFGALTMNDKIAALRHKEFPQAIFEKLILPAIVA